MFSFFKKNPATTHLAEINGKPVEVLPKETLLHAALREGIDFPHSCRVGGCASCKCRLVDGSVKELTDIGYILSDAELDQGYILACQSVPTSDVTIEVSLSEQAQRTRVSARVVQQERLTHDITHLKLQLLEALDYRAGQYADLTLDSLPGVSRSYSFATPPQPDGTLSFFVRKVPGGVFSTEVNDRDLLGQSVTVTGPSGDFWLRPSDAPIVMIAGGSGLAPILAILRGELARSSRRPVTLLFGARSQQDLYALDDIREIAQQWGAPFIFTPILSNEAPDTEWQGARGWVTDLIPTLSLTGSEAYLCGPPAMIDSAVVHLSVAGIERGSIFADRFTTIGDVVKAEDVVSELID
ncbi:2Fe-2S iron-sulfur cluster-binding protein [Marinobacter zhejiangensis]|uniref:3-phenylpropionate/trans-cinnamate dioxygenase ferredoxin reductase subunit n=1 Tax=Marinobacter zhejiangensis TaxID=488535 RepID=A0A1I4PF11_9GAMM|nr:2Fe-2S iron-sulfur cluster binding domain-containing protein [Marinobacter zhejiangensis]SFM26260.1 3-phenylpropionate/trans-cinnamate dioxygenase ferredoxin reductase subunit [Marinobacter zhejiangensis]